MQPYQEATQEIKRQGELPLDLAKKGVSMAAGAATAYFGSSAVSKVLPFLSKYVPQDIAIKALNKINPGYGKFINKALEAGQTFEDVQEFIGNKIQEGKPKEDKNVIQQYSPELFNFIQGEVQKGRPILETVSMANTLDKFKPIIKKITADHKTPFANIVQSIFGVGGGGDIGTAIGSAFQSQQPQVNPKEQARQQGLQQFNQKIKKPNTIQEERERFNKGYGGQQPNLDDEILSEISNLFKM
jgi:hypothetical protein